MATYLDEKNLTATLLGSTDGGTDAGNQIRNASINAARRWVVNKYPFSWLIKTDDITITSNQGDMPSDYNPTHIIKDARVETTGSNNDTIYRQVPIESRDDTSGQNIFWMTYESGTYKINTSLDSGTLTIYYFHMPDDLSDDTDVEIITDIDAVCYKAAATTFLGEERQNEIYDKYSAIAEQRIAEMILADKRANPMPIVDDFAEVFDNEYNTPTRGNSNTGYNK